MSVEKYRSCNVDKQRPKKYRRYRDRYFYTKVSSISISIHQKYRRYYRYRYRYSILPTLPTSMTLNDLKQRNSPYFAFFSAVSISLLAKYVAVVEKYLGYIVRKYCHSVPVFHFWPLLTHPAARSLCDSWARPNCWVSIPQDQSASKIWGLYLEQFQRY